MEVKKRRPWGFNPRRRRLKTLVVTFLGYIALRALVVQANAILGNEYDAQNIYFHRQLLQQNSSSDNESCIHPAIEQFPKPLMHQEVRSHGGIIVHFTVTVYMFVAIAMICDDYFVPSLEIICERLEMSEDVAGATFMAAGSSAPELATAVIAVFIAKDDIGVSGVIGSAIFNITFVIAVCGLFAGVEISLNWWPILRDCVFYCISICGLLITIYNEKVSWYESVFLLLLYVLYCVVMVYNKELEAWANKLNIPFKNQGSRDEKSSLFGSKPVVQNASVGHPTQDGSEDADEFPLLMDDANCLDTGNEVKAEEATEVECAAPKSMAPEPKEGSNKWEMPVGLLERIYWATTLPVVFLHHVTIPDCRRANWRKWYVMTFAMSMVWIAVWSYIMVWMITIIGYTLGIPDTVMGLTLVAVGVSVPDALASLCVAKQGFGDMAVSNAIGSNVFDILICLGIPWFIKTVLVEPGSIVEVESKGLTYSTVSLFSTVVFLIVCTHYNSWKLDKKYGIILIIWYLIFMIFALLYEMNVFGELKRRECQSDY